MNAPRRHLPVAEESLGRPTGWFSLGLARDLAPGAVKTVRFFGHELVLFRGESGAVGLLDAHCPHLGAHMGHGGTIVGETLRCPFHGFCFEASGACSETGYKKKVPPGLRAGAWEVVERHGVLLAWHDAEGKASAWDVPDVDMDGWSPFLLHEWTLRGHPQETTENSVDLGHFAAVHGYDDAHETQPLRIDGPTLYSNYRFARRIGGRRSPVVVHEDIAIEVRGLGYSRVEVRDVATGTRIRLLVLPTSEDDTNIRLRIGLSIRDYASNDDARPWLRLVPATVTRRLVAPLLLQAYAGEVSQDFAVWKNKRYVPRPGLAEGDGPIGPYRRWARQFYG